MAGIDDYFLGDCALHDRFIAIAEVLARLVASAPRSVSMTQLEEATGLPGYALVSFCESLTESGLLEPDDAGRWRLTRESASVTLADALRCVLVEQLARQKKRTGKKRPVRDTPYGVHLLVTQAVIAINQSVFSHLRQFPLDRLKISSSGPFPCVKRALRDPSLEEGFDRSGPVQEGNPIRPIQFNV